MPKFNFAKEADIESEKEDKNLGKKSSEWQRELNKLTKEFQERRKKGGDPEHEDRVISDMARDDFPTEKNQERKLFLEEMYKLLPSKRKSEISPGDWINYVEERSEEKKRAEKEKSEETKE